MQIGTLEAYSLKLERQVADLREENGLLHHAVEVLQQGHASPVQGKTAVLLLASVLLNPEYTFCI